MKTRVIQKNHGPTWHTLLSRCILSTWILLLFLCDKVAGQHPHPSFRPYTIEDGLAASDVYQIKQDSRGYIWFATSNGVSRFDGYTFENFSKNDGLPDNTVFEIFEDKKGRIWFLPLSCKLSYYQNGKIHVYEHNDKVVKVTRNFIKTSFYVDDNDNIYLGIYHIGMYKIHPDGTITGYDTTSAGGRMASVVELNPGQLIFSAFQASGGGKDYINFYTKYQQGKLPITADVSSFFKMGRAIRLKNGKILLSYHNQLITVDKDMKYSVHKFPAQITWLYEDKNNHIWIGTYMSGVYFVQDENYPGAKCYLQGKSVDGVLEDAEGGFWFGTEGDAVFYTPSDQVLTYDQAAGLKSDHVNALATDGENIYAGLSDGSLARISPDGKITSLILKFDPHKNEISSLFYDALKKELWFSGRLYQGIINTDFKTVDFYIGVFYQGMAFENQYYFASGTHLQRFLENNRIGAFEQTRELGVGTIYSLLPYKNRSMLLGTQWGLWKYTFSDSSYTFMGGQNPLLQQRISYLAYLPDSSIAIATNSEGLLVYNNGDVNQISSKDGLCSDKINKIYIDGNTIWVATDHGVNQVEIISMRPFSYKVETYTKKNGLASNEIKDIVVLKGKVWLASDKGIIFFDRSLQMNTRSGDISVYITKIAINEQETDMQDEYILPYYRNNIKISFTAPGFKNAGKQQYRYKMDGLDTAWIYTLNREIQYTTLPTGDYTFTVEVQNSDGSWSSITDKATFRIITPFWQKWWFIACCIMAGILFIGWIVRSRLKYIQARKEKINHLNRSLLDLKLKALRAQMNPHFTFNVMNSIQHFILHKEDEAAQRYLTKFSRLIRIILNNSEKNMIPASEEIKALELYLELEMMRFEGKFIYAITIDPSVDTHRVIIPSMLIQPYVENAVLHGVAPLDIQGHITIHMERTGDFIRTTVQDNGVGRLKASEKKKEDGYRSMGMAITQERLEIINQLHGNKMSEKITDLYDMDGNPIGTRVEVFVPYLEKTRK